MKKAAIIIGESQRDSAEFRPLIGVGNDMADMHGFLQHLAGYDLVQLLRDEGKAQVLAALEQVLGQLAAGDRLLIYFTGHGHGVRGEHVLVCRGATRSLMEYFHEVIPVNHLRRATDGRGLERAVIVDSCWDSPYAAGSKGGPSRLSGEQAQYLKDLAAVPLQPTAAGVTGSFSLLCGCGQDQVAIEVPRLRRGLFTAALVTVLKSASQGHRELRLSDELRDDVAKQMRLLGEEHGLAEVPQPLHSGSGQAPLIIDGAAPVSAPAAVAYARPELTVAADGSGQYRTIGQAVQAAAAGALIRVLPGLYREGIKVDKPLEIAGEGPAQWVIVENDAGPCLLATAHAATVRGLSLRCTAGGKAAHCHAVDIPSGCLLLENCEVTSNVATTTSDFACVCVSGAQTHPIIRQCIVHDGSALGIVVIDHAAATIEDCDIFAHAHSAVLVDKAADCVARRCKIHDTRGGGILVREKGRATLEDCEFFAQDEEAVAVATEGAAALRRCKIRDSRGNGVLIKDHGTAKLDDCDIWGHQMPCVLVHDFGEVELRGCVIRDGKSNGMVVYLLGKTMMEDCDVFGHQLPAMGLAVGGEAQMRRCRIHDCRGDGIVFQGGRGTLEDCDIWGHVGIGVGLRECAEAVLRRCKVHDGKGSGIELRSRSQATLEDCDIFAHALPCIAIETRSHAVARQCRIHDGKAAGVSVQRQGGGTFENCEFWNNAAKNFDIGEGCEVRRRGIRERESAYGQLTKGLERFDG